ncbi:hypothetical protein LINGRAHAP2_LOCUS6758 [Linum grandiflorum]
MELDWMNWFLSLVWYGWKQCNRIIHGSEPWPTLTVWQMVRTLAGELQTLQSCPPKQMAAPRRFGWQKPQPGWIKINVDGSRNEGLNSAAFGGVLRDKDGGWIVGLISVRKRV